MIIEANRLSKFPDESNSCDFESALKAVFISEILKNGIPISIYMYKPN